MFISFEGTEGVGKTTLIRRIFETLQGKPQGAIALQEEDIAALGIGIQQLVDHGHGEAAVLLARSRQNDIADDVEGDVERLGLVVPEVAHLKAASEHFAHIEQATVHGIAAGRLIVNIDIPVALRLKLLDIEEKLLIQLLVKLVENQASAGGNQRAVRVGILLIADIHDRLALLIDRVEHLHEVCLIIAVVAIGLGHSRADGVQRALHDVVHLHDMHAFGAQRFAFFGYEAADEIQIFLGETIKHALGAFVDRGNDLCYVERVFCAVLFDDVHRHPPSADLVDDQ